MTTRVFVVANPPEGEQIAGWLRPEIGDGVRVGEGSDDTLTELTAAPAQVVVLASGLRTGDALAFVVALRDAGSGASLVLIGDEVGPVRTALDAMEFHADRFLRRPLSRSALTFAVRSCLNLGRPGLVQSVSPRRGPAPLLSAFAALGDIAPAAPASAEISSGVAQHTLVARIDRATTEAIDTFLHDAVELALGEVNEEDAGEAPPEPERESTLVLSGGEAAPASPAAPEELRTGTFVSALRQHMSAFEARLFGEGGARRDDDDTADIDLDAIGVSVPAVGPDEGPPPVTARDDEPRVVVEGTGERPTTAPRAAHSATTSGSLADEDAATLLGRLLRAGFTGRAALRHGDVEKTVYLEDGRPVFVRSDAAADRMGEMLLREGKITREQLGRAQEILVATGRRMGEILVEQGALKRRELLPAVRRHVEDLLYSPFAWETGSYTLTPGPAAREEKIRLASPAATLIVEGIRRRLGPERLHALVGAGTLVAAKREEVAEALAEVELSAEERRALDLLDGRRPFAEVAVAAGLDELGAYQLAHGLAALGLARPPRDATTDAGRGTTGVSAPPGSITGAADAAIDRERVLAKHAHVCEADYFEVLGVRRDATAFEIRRAFETARRDYAADGFAAEVQRELAAELAEIGEILVEALRVLRDDAIRASYVSSIAAEDR